MAHKIDTVTARSRLPVRREPYWQRIRGGLYIGYRKMSANSSGAWQCRYIDESGREKQVSLGTLDDCPAHKQFDHAVEHAQQTISRLAGAPVVVIAAAATVMAACERYVKRVRELRGENAADDLEARYRRWVKSDRICTIELQKLVRKDLDEFRQRMLSSPVQVNKAGDLRERSKDSVNRDMAALRSALNQALADGLVATDAAWRDPLKAYKNAVKRRGLYLDRDQRRAFIDHAPADLANFLRALSLLPLRPGALAGLKVADLDVRLGVLKIGKDKSGQDRNIKLPPATAKLFQEAACGRAEHAPLFARADGQAWNKDSWKYGLKDAARAAGLPSNTVAYTLRHSVISDLVHGGLDLLTVAQISGTSVAMIEKHYGHLRSNVASDALAKLAL